MNPQAKPFLPSMISLPHVKLTPAYGQSVVALPGMQPLMVPLPCAEEDWRWWVAEQEAFDKKQRDSGLFEEWWIRRGNGLWQQHQHGRAVTNLNTQNWILGDCFDPVFDPHFFFIADDTPDDGHDTDEFSPPPAKGGGHQRTDTMGSVSSVGSVIIGYDPPVADSPSTAQLLFWLREFGSAEVWGTAHRDPVSPSGRCRWEQDEMVFEEKLPLAVHLVPPLVQASKRWLKWYATVGVLSFHEYYMEKTRPAKAEKEKRRRRRGSTKSQEAAPPSKEEHEAVKQQHVDPAQQQAAASTAAAVSGGEESSKELSSRVANRLRRKKTQPNGPPKTDFLGEKFVFWLDKAAAPVLAVADMKSSSTSSLSESPLRARADPPYWPVAFPSRRELKKLQGEAAAEGREFSLDEVPETVFVDTISQFWSLSRQLDFAKLRLHYDCANLHFFRAKQPQVLAQRGGRRSSSAALSDDTAPTTKTPDDAPLSVSPGNTTIDTAEGSLSSMAIEDAPVPSWEAHPNGGIVKLAPELEVQEEVELGSEGQAPSTVPRPPVEDSIRYKLHTEVWDRVCSAMLVSSGIDRARNIVLSDTHSERVEKLVRDLKRDYPIPEDKRPPDGRDFEIHLKNEEQVLPFWNWLVGVSFNGDCIKLWLNAMPSLEDGTIPPQFAALSPSEYVTHVVRQYANNHLKPNNAPATEIAVNDGSKGSNPPSPSKKKSQFVIATTDFVVSCRTIRSSLDHQSILAKKATKTLNKMRRTHSRQGSLDISQDSTTPPTTPADTSAKKGARPPPLSLGTGLSSQDLFARTESSKNVFRSTTTASRPHHPARGSMMNSSAPLWTSSSNRAPSSIGLMNRAADAAKAQQFASPHSKPQVPPSRPLNRPLSQVELEQQEKFIQGDEMEAAEWQKQISPLEHILVRAQTEVELTGAEEQKKERQRSGKTHRRAVSFQLDNEHQPTPSTQLTSPDEVESNVRMAKLVNSATPREETPVDDDDNSIVEYPAVEEKKLQAQWQSLQAIEDRVESWRKMAHKHSADDVLLRHARRHSRNSTQSDSQDSPRKEAAQPSESSQSK